MSDRQTYEPTALELMEYHVEALFTHDRNGRLRHVNEPWPGAVPAPRLFLGRTADGPAVYRFRHDVPETLVGQLAELCADEPIVTDFETKPKHLDAYGSLLQGERVNSGPCFLVPDHTAPTAETIALTRDNAAEWLHGRFEWLIEELDYAQPCMALVRDGRAVSVCRSVRITSRAHEAGLETLDDDRGKGYAAAVVAGWAKAVREAGRLPLYSTSWDNRASRRVAEKSGLVPYGVAFTIF
ncbi:GNAT family N-acetyltransferase [Paenibacillus flagellatus]|uniref:GNAT family N-acetyltransferase n=1 Tax=Paenibacillus flagellatus TaxID=2211139 RepID=A0A2V5K582_9BACL|nr:GNAT family N-acetyltransferase [Paenibacillus flagellatus]PYI53902.1 GNAT family N-acetyltransferase [Paenibacillus flagellatus]